MKTIITIGRQFGSGGKEIGIRVAKELGKFLTIRFQFSLTCQPS